MGVTLFQCGPRPFLRGAVLFQQVGGNLASIAFHFATLPASFPRSSHAWTKLDSTSLHTAMSMEALITNIIEGVKLPGLFSGEKDGTKM